jgi:hypothetical protein
MFSEYLQQAAIGMKKLQGEENINFLKIFNSLSWVLYGRG